MWRVICDAHRVMKHMADEASMLLLSPGAQEEGGIRGPLQPPGPTRTAFSIVVSYAAKQQAAPVDAIILLSVAVMTFHFLFHMNCMNCMYMCYLDS